MGSQGLVDGRLEVGGGIPEDFSDRISDGIPQGLKLAMGSEGGAGGVAVRCGLG